ncbi:cytochrome P450- family 81- subfamily D-polypeptide 8 [Striga hermonthica]|uniref:(+)-piperitol/(+)-sesamin synthase n=1 Tax=Striga hermonthica TaxID=68872 RepID=A0A9N7N4R3_STRHE|nr:cytochrome P450- family 81- subfamily D-polypeptide 8 [Striga hermonthica]
MEPLILYSLHCFSLLAFLYVLLPLFLRKLGNLPPSPPISLPIIGHLYLLKQPPPLHRTLSKISRKFGPVVLLHFGSRPVLLVSSPSSAEECLSTNDVAFACRPRLLAGKILGHNYSTLVWAPYGDWWRNLRRVATTQILSAHRIRSFGETRADEVRRLVCRLSAPAPAAVDVRTAVFEMVLNIMTRMVAGKRYYDDGSGDSLGEAKEFKEMVTEIFRVSGATNAGDFLPVLRWLGVNGLEKRLKKLQVRRDRFYQNLIDERRRTTEIEKGEKDMTLIDVLLADQETDPEVYTDEYVQGMIQVMLAAGTDTSALTIEWAMSLLLNHPESLIRAQAEIDSTIGHSRLVNDSDLPNLPYLHAIINETLRMYPVGPLLVPHEASTDCVVGGYRVPRGTMLLVNVWAIQNDPNLWEDPRAFKPERFANFQGQRDGFKFVPFGYGRRGCPGENLAMHAVGLALASLIQCLEWERVGSEEVDMNEGLGLTIPKAQPLVAKCRLRREMGELIGNYK